MAAARPVAQVAGAPSGIGEAASSALGDAGPRVGGSLAEGDLDGDLFGSSGWRRLSCP